MITPETAKEWGCEPIPEASADTRRKRLSTRQFVSYLGKLVFYGGLIVTADKTLDAALLNHQADSLQPKQSYNIMIQADTLHDAANELMDGAVACLVVTAIGGVVGFAFDSEAPAEEATHDNA